MSVYRLLLVNMNYMKIRYYVYLLVVLVGIESLSQVAVALARLNSGETPNSSCGPSDVGCTVAIASTPSSAVASDSITRVALAIKTINYDLPINLSIPKINVNSIIEQVGLTLDGAVDVPKSPPNAGWFELGPRPGEKGNAVIVGHYGPWKNGQISVFNNLNKLKQGDEIYVKNGFGGINIFIVREIRSFDDNANATEIFVSTDEKSHLVLITCEGVWNPITKSYPERLVVFSDKK